MNSLVRTEKFLDIKSQRQLGCLPVHKDPRLLAKHGNDGLRHKLVGIRGIVYPTSTQQISSVLSDAYSRNLPVHVISRGKNWGYGASAPNVDDCILVDLSNMNRIVHLDIRLGIAEIEPGVSQGQLYKALKGTGLMMDVTGAGPATSIVGNVLERGLGHTPLGIRSQHFIVSEIVLTDGQIVPLAGHGDASGHSRIGLTAGLHELLQQNNLAVVSRMRVPLMRIPEQRLRCILCLDEEDRLPEYIEAMRFLKQEGVFDGLPHLGNDIRILSLLKQFDFGRWDPADGISNKDLENLRRKYRIPRWTLACGIYGSKSMAKAKAKLAKQYLGKIGRVQILSSESVRRTNNFLMGLNSWAGKFLGAQFNLLVRNFDEHAELLSLIDGFPTGLALKGCYWRNRRKAWRPHSDPIEDQCGFRWLSPTLPMKGEAIHEMLTIARSYYAGHGFEFAATLTVVTTKTCQGVLSIYFDAENQEERGRANRLAAALKEEFYNQGWLSYRLPNDEMSEGVDNAHPNVVALRNRIKGAFDKKAILSPGRYAPIPASVQK